MSDSCGHAHSFDGMNDDYKRRLMIVTAINIGMFVIEMVAGQLAGSQALKADALDFFADGLTYALSFWAIGNVAVVVAAVLVALLGNGAPDLIVAGVMAALFLNSAFQILRQSWAEWRHAREHPGHP